MRNLLILILLSGCATAHADTSLARDVQRQGPGLYSVSERQAGFGNALKQAVAQCSLENKKLIIEATTMETGRVSGRSYPVTIFRCV